MPNHVINEVIFREVTELHVLTMLSKMVRADNTVDFGIMLPLPLSSWPGSVGSIHKKRFPSTHLDDASAIWGTKWNAYGQDGGAATRDGDSLILRFQTAWSPPMGWLAAVLNTFRCRFEHNWLSEGSEHGFSAVFDHSKLDSWKGEAWDEKPAAPAMQRHLHKLLWGVEEFAEDA